MSAVVRKMFALLVATTVCASVACSDSMTIVAVHVKALNTTMSRGNSSCRSFHFTLSPIGSSCQVQDMSPHSMFSVEYEDIVKTHWNQTVYIQLQESKNQWFLLISISCCQKATNKDLPDEVFHIKLTASVESIIESSSQLSWLLATVAMVNVSKNQLLSPVLMPPRLCSNVSSSGNNTTASNNMLKLILGLTIAGGAVALFVLLFVTSVYRNRRQRQQQRHNMNGVAGNSSLSTAKLGTTETLGRQLQVHTFGRALTPERAATPSQLSLEDPDFYNVLPPLMYSDVLRASTILDNLSTRPNSMMSTTTAAHRSKSFESTLNEDNTDGGVPLMHTNTLAISLHDIDSQQEPMRRADITISTSI